MICRGRNGYAKVWVSLRLLRLFSTTNSGRRQCTSSRSTALLNADVRDRCRTRPSWAMAASVGSTGAKTSIMSEHCGSTGTKDEAWSWHSRTTRA